jgi:PmbA protein
MGKTIFRNNINIINNPHIKRGLASKPYDAEGVKNAKMHIIENGILQNWLLDIRSAGQLGLVTNGCASRSLATPPSPSSSNLYMENGTESPASLIAAIKTGFYVTETFGMGINIITGDYSQGASGFWIENGEITYPVSEITIAGSLAEMFSQAIPANDLEFIYSINSPTLLIEKMTVAGV